MKKIIICLCVSLISGNIAMAQSQQDKTKGNVVIDAATGLTQAEKDAGKPYIVNNTIENTSQPIVHITPNTQKEVIIPTVKKNEDLKKVKSVGDPSKSISNSTK